MRELRTAFLEYDEHPTLPAFYAFFRQCLNHGFDPNALGYTRAKRMLRKKQAEVRFLCTSIFPSTDTYSSLVPCLTAQHAMQVHDAR